MDHIHFNFSDGGSMKSVNEDTSGIRFDPDTGYTFRDMDFDDGEWTVCFNT